MASLFVENFEGAADGDSLTSANSGFTGFAGSGLKFAASPAPPQGALGLSITAAAAGNPYAENTFTATATFFRRFYLYPPAGLTGSIDVVTTRGSNASRNRLRLNADRTVSLLSGSTVVWTSVTALPAGQWSRIEMRIDNGAGQQQARLYVGADPHTSTVSEDSGNRTYNQGTIDSARLGQSNSTTTASTTVFYDAVADDDTNWPGPAVATSTGITAGLSGAGTLSAAVTAVTTSITAGLSGAGTLSVSVAAVPVPTPPPSHSHTWAVWARDPADYTPTRALKIDSVKIVRKHMGVDTAIVTTPYDPEAWAVCAPSSGVLVYRDGRQEFSGQIAARQLNWDAETDPRPLITLECLGDEVHLADRLVMPDPLRAGDDQTVNDYWTFTGVASSAMWRMVSDQAGPTCRADRRVSGLVMGADPGVGLSRTWKQLFSAAGPNGVMDALAVISAASGLDLGIRVTSADGQLTVDVAQPRDLTDGVKFSTDMRNLVGIFYRETAPTVTHALVAGQGDLHLRSRKLVVTAVSLALAWGRQIWSYIDRRDTNDATELTQAGQDALDQGPATVALTVRLTDSQAAAYGKDYDLGDKVTVYVGLPDQTAVATVSDVIREIALSVDNTGKETVQPTIGSYDAKAIRRTPTQEQLAASAAGLAGLISRK